MSSVASPFGLKPAFHPSGTLRQSHGSIASAYNTDIFQFDPVKIVAGGTLELGAVDDRIVGAFMGVEWTATDGRRRVGNRWIANEVGTDIVAYYTEDPAIIYEIQADAPFLLTAMGEQFNWNTPAGSTTTGLSSTSLDIASSAANAGLRAIGVNPAPDNIIGDLFTIVQVQISEHQYVADRAAI